MSPTRPTKKQRELLDFIAGFITGHGYSPSYREIMRALNYKSVSTVASHVDNLIARGHIVKRDNSARSLEVLRKSIEDPTELPEKPHPVQEKWLIDRIAAKFHAAEKTAAQAGDLDQLYVLVGALHILGFADAARAYKSRLHDLVHVKLQE
jgi:SOS-response transcriptional repressor LexA